MQLLFFYLALALLVSFLCSVAEAVILSVTTSYIRMRESEGGRWINRLKQHKQQIDRPLAAILTINTIAHTIGAAGVGAQAVAVFGEIYFGLISAILTILILVFSEIVPKSIGANYWQKLAIPVTIVITLMIYLSYPLVVVSEFLTRAISRNKPPNLVTREEVVALAQLGNKDGALDESESRVIDNIVGLKDLRARDIMTPRTVLVAARQDTGLSVYVHRQDLLEYSRLPIFAEDVDHITGYVLKADVLECVAQDKAFENQVLADLKRPLLAFFEGYPVRNLFESFILKRELIALIVDEFGGVCGIVTMEDVIEAILGLDIVDESGGSINMQQVARSRWKVRKQRLGLEDPEEG